MSPCRIQFLLPMNGTPGNLQTTIHGIHTEECVTNPNKNLLAAKKKHVIEGRRQTLHQKLPLLQSTTSKQEKYRSASPSGFPITTRSITPHTHTYLASSHSSPPPFAQHQEQSRSAPRLQCSDPWPSCFQLPSVQTRSYQV